MAFIAIRGGTPLGDDIELKAHLASLLRLENVGLLLGAGASVSAGGKVIRALWNDFISTSAADAQWLLDQGFLKVENIRPPMQRPPPPPPPNMPVPRAPPPPPPGAPAPVQAPAAPVAAAAIQVAEIPNIEELADSLEIAIIEWGRQNNGLVDRAKEVRASLFRAVLRAAILRQSHWTSPSTVDIADDGLRYHRSVLQKLTSARQPGQAPPWVFTTNYDLAVEWAAESVDIQVQNGFLGLHTRRFSPQSFDLGFRNVQARGEARFGVYNIYLAKLHGSLTWKSHEGQMFELPASQAWPEIDQFLQGRTNDLSYLVLPRAAKYLQTIGFTLGELLRRFSEFMARPQTALIIAGYGFGDEHINRLIRSAMLNPTLQIVMYLPEFSGSVDDRALAPTVRRLLALNNPRLTIVGGMAGAYFDKLAEHLPDPTVFNEDLKDLERRLRPIVSDHDLPDGEL